MLQSNIKKKAESRTYDPVLCFFIFGTNKLRCCDFGG